MVATWCTDMLQILLFLLSLVMLTKLKLEKKTEATVLQKKKKETKRGHLNRSTKLTEL